jgi:hypothetical protein
MRSFSDATGQVWTAHAIEAQGVDYKGRWILNFSQEGSDASAPIPLQDVRWNSESTAERTLQTISDVELRRRLRIVLGRTEAA